MPPSKTQVNKAGKLLRNWFSGRSVLLSPSETDHAFDVITAYRRQWVDPPRPYTTLYARLFEQAREAGPEHVVGRRLKRVDRIVRKLVRHPRMALTKMEDIAGCRLVVPDLPALELATELMSDRWAGQIARVRDYVSSPKATGYRAVHLTVISHGLPVEVQLRTRRQQLWAAHVEFLEDRDGTLLKDGDGSAATLDQLRDLGERLAAADVAGLPLQSKALEFGDHWDTRGS